jgi:hypothetical protein
LISVVEEDGSQVVQFSHFSVKEFLTSSRLAGSSANVSRFHILLETAHTILAKACLGVLLRLDEHVDVYNIENSFPLARYAAEHWVDHAQFENVSSHIREGMGYLFDPDKPYFAAWLQVHDIDTEPPYRSTLFHFYVLGYERNTATPLYYATLCGFHDLAEHLIMKHPQQVNANGGHYVSPLGAALGKEHLDVAQLLCQHGADVNVQGFKGRTPLRAVSSERLPEIVEWLLSHGANPNIRGDDFWTPLHMATSWGQVEVSRSLLQHKADQNAPDSDGQTPLHVASKGGQINLARLLLEHGVDVSAQDNNHSTALHLASERSKLEVACLLLEHGADVDAEDNDGRTPLQVASGRHRDEITKLLSERRILKSRDTS